MLLWLEVCTNTTAVEISRRKGPWPEEEDFKIITTKNKDLGCVLKRRECE